MKTNMYSIKDDLIGYGVPFATDNDAVAMSYFHSAVVQENSIYSLNKSHFNLYKVGTFDTESGNFDPIDPAYVCSALDFDKEK